MGIRERRAANNDKLPPQSGNAKSVNNSLGKRGGSERGGAARGQRYSSRGRGDAGRGSWRGRGDAGRGSWRGRGDAGRGSWRGRGVAREGSSRGRGVAGRGSSRGRGVAGRGSPRGRGLAGRGFSRGRGVTARGSSRGRGDRGRGGSASGRGGFARGRRGTTRGRGGFTNSSPNHDKSEEEPVEHKSEPVEDVKTETTENKLPNWMIKKQQKDEKVVVEKVYKVILNGLTENLRTFSEIKELTDNEKITPSKTFIEDNVVFLYRQKKHALKACHLLCGYDFKGAKLHAVLETKNDEKANRRTRVIIRNLPWSCTEEKLEALMNEFGAVTEVKIPKKDDGRMRGFGFVQFTHPHESAKAISKVKQIEGRRVALDWSLPREIYQEIKDKEDSKNEEPEDSEDDEEVKSEDYNNNSDKEDEMEVDTDQHSDEDDDEDDIDDNIENNKKCVDDVNEKKTEKRKNVTGPDVLEGRSVFLRNIPFDATDSSIESMCSPYGQVKKVNIVKNQAGVSKGLAFVEFSSSIESENCVANSKELNLEGRPIFARISLPQAEILRMKKEKTDEQKAKPDKRNLTLAREGEIRAGSKAAKGISEEDQKRRINFAKLKYDKLKNLDNYIDPCKLMIHNVPKTFTEDQIRLLSQKAANGDVNKDVKKNKIKIKSCHLMMDKDDKTKSLGYAFSTFNSNVDALRCLRVLNNHPTIFAKDKRPIVEFAVENAKAVRLLADRRERSKKKKDLQLRLLDQPVAGTEPKKEKKLRPWQIAMQERKNKKRSIIRTEEEVKMEIIESEPVAPKKAKLTIPVNLKADYAGLEVKKGTSGRLQRPRHSAAKIRVRDKGRLVREEQRTKIAKRKARLAKLGVTAVQKNTKVKKKTPIERDNEDFENLVREYKQKIAAKLN